MKNIAAILFFMPLVSFAQSEGDFDSLGGNKVLLERAKALNPEAQISVVQERAVTRRQRVEISPEFSGTFGGDTYSRTRSVGLNVHYHFTPRWSAGLKYNYAFNTLTAEGEEMADQAYKKYLQDPENPNSPVPDMDYIKNETMALVNWYPMYGKINLLDMGVTQFDVYVLAGYGQVSLRSGNAPTYTTGIGVGLWFTQHFSSRLEVRYQNYKAQYYNGEKQLDVAVGGIQMGWLL